ncbi:MAG: hypothetical protein ACRCT1_06305 [Microcoleaceae cyanobacterium]
MIITISLHDRIIIAEGRRKKEEGRRKKEEAIKSMVGTIKNVLTLLAVAILIYDPVRGVILW